MSLFSYASVRRCCIGVSSLLVSYRSRLLFFSSTDVRICCVLSALLVDPVSLPLLLGIFSGTFSRPLLGCSVFNANDWGRSLGGRWSPAVFRRTALSSAPPALALALRSAMAVLTRLPHIAFARSMWLAVRALSSVRPPSASIS